MIKFGRFAKNKTLQNAPEITLRHIRISILPDRAKICYSRFWSDLRTFAIAHRKFLSKNPCFELLGKMKKQMLRFQQKRRVIY